MLAKVVNAQGEAAGTSYTSQEKSPWNSGTAGILCCQAPRAHQLTSDFCEILHPIITGEMLCLF